jgi:rhodanese-related sulfurtransferase
MTVHEHPVTDYASVVSESAQFLDVRQPGEVAGGTLPGAVNIPLDELPRRTAELDRLRRTVVLCRSGGRSSQAAELLTSIGFTEVVNLTGGLLAFEATH